MSKIRINDEFYDYIGCLKFVTLFVLSCHVLERVSRIFLLVLCKPLVLQISSTIITTEKKFIHLTSKI